MTRADLLDYLINTLGELLEEANVYKSDITGGMQFSLDQTIALVDSTADDIAFQTVGEYYTLRRIRNVLAARVDFDATAIEGGSRSAVFNQVTELLTEAQERASAVGYPVTGDSASESAYGLTSLYMDYIEPEPTDA